MRNNVRNIITALLAVMVCCVPAMAQSTPEVTPVSGLQRVYKGKYHFVDEATGDRLCMIVMNPITVYPPERFKNKKEEEFYWRTVRDVKKTLPYAKLICSTLLETYEYLETFETEKEKISGLIWHHYEELDGEKPIMQLVDEKLHSACSHTGGSYTWNKKHLI